MTVTMPFQRYCCKSLCMRSAFSCMTTLLCQDLRLSEGQLMETDGRFGTKL